MLVEQDTAVLLEDNEDLAAVYIGGAWSSFMEMLPEPQSKILVDGFNLILLSAMPPFDIESPYDQYNIPDTVVLSAAQDILIADDLDTQGIKLNLFSLCSNNIIQLLSDLGITFFDDEVHLENLPDLIKIGKIFYDFESIDDKLNLHNILTSRDIHPKDRFINAFKVFYGEDYDTSIIEMLIEDVSEVTTESLLKGLNVRDDLMDDVYPPSIIQRITDNKEFLEGTLIREHLTNGGGIGGSIQSFTNFYEDQLSTLLSSDKESDQFQYVREMTAIYLVSEVNTDSLIEKLMVHLDSIFEDLAFFSKTESYINKLNLTTA